MFWSADRLLTSTSKYSDPFDNNFGGFFLYSWTLAYSGTISTWVYPRPMWNMYFPQRLNCWCVSCIPCCWAKLNFPLSFPSIQRSRLGPRSTRRRHKHSYKAPHSAFVASERSCPGLVVAPKSAERTFHLPGPGGGRDTFSTKIRDHEMVLQENIFPSVVLGSGELYWFLPFTTWFIKSQKGR